MTISRVRAAAGADAVVLERGRLRVEIALRPFELTVHRARPATGSVAGCMGGGRAPSTTTSSRLTEGVVAHEDLAPVERARAAVVQAMLGRPGDAGAVD